MHNLAWLVGWVSIATGAWLWHPGAGLIVGGAALLITTILAATEHEPNT